MLRSDCSSGWKRGIFLGAEQGGMGLGGVSFPIFRLCCFLFKKKLLLFTEELVTLIFSTWQFPSCDDFSKDNLETPAKKAEFLCHFRLP